jgi:biotin carboxyl carrier protein
MKLVLRIDGADEQFIEILSPAPRCRFRLGDSPELCADVEVPEPGVYSVLIDGRSYEARVEESPNALIVVIDGRRFEIEARDPRRLSRKSGAAGADGIQPIAAPMPGKVVRVLVAVGDDVTAGQGLLVVEAMKMQNEMKAPKAGKVLSIHGAEGATVTAGEVLATIG